MPDEHDDRQLLRAILDHCTARGQALPGPMPTPEAQARRRVYEKVARAARELLEEMDA
jgi:hypothetical protein